jgi:hypothetical protein
LSPYEKEQCVLALVRSKTAVVLAIVAVMFWALGNALSGLALAVFNHYQSFLNLTTASNWLLFVAAAFALGAASSVLWHQFTSRQWSGIWEIAAATVSTLLFSIGLLVVAAQSPNGSTAANVVTAIGLGGWALLLLATAAQRALVEQDNPGTLKQSGLRLAAAGSVLLLAVAQGLPNFNLDQTTLAVSSAVLSALGFGGLAITISAARARNLIASTTVPYLIVALWVLVADGLAHAIAYGIVFGPSPSLNSIRIGLAIPQVIATIGFAVLAFAGLSRANELTPRSPSGAWSGTWPPSGPLPPEVSPGAPPPQGEAPVPAAPVSEPTVPPSWQADPSGRHELRWWGGTGWSEHVIDQGQPSIDPLQ